MGAPRTRTETMQLEVILGVSHACLGHFGTFYDKFLHPCQWFTKNEFCKIMNQDYCSPEKYRDVVFALQWIHEKINKGRSNPEWHIGPIVPDSTGDRCQQEDPIRYLIVTGQGKNPVTLESLEEDDEE